MQITYFGHSCFHFDTGEQQFIVDPFIRPNPLAKDIDVSQIRADHILLTHGHGDHVADVEEIAKKNKATIVSNFEVVQWFENKGVQGHPMNTGGSWQFDFGSVKMVNAVHSSSMPDGSYGGNPVGFIVNTGGQKFYIAGDTALTPDMSLIPKYWGPLDFAILPVGDNFTMDYKDAIVAAKLIECDEIVACHFDTFGYIKIDHDIVSKAFADAGLSLKIPTIGETWEK